MYEVGKVYIWQNRVGDAAVLNGMETTVLGKSSGRDLETGEYFNGWQTDTPSSKFSGMNISAKAGELRLKNPPRGEQKIRDLFEPKPLLEPA